MSIKYRIVEHHGTYFPSLNITIGEYWMVNGKKFYHKPSEKEVEDAYSYVDVKLQKR